MRDAGFATAQTAVLERYGVPVEESWIDVPVVRGQAHVLTAGQGPPVVMLAGIGVPAAMLAPLMARLGGMSLHAVDLPGYGLTDTAPGFGHDLRADAVRFLVEVLDGLGLDRPAVLANSLGSLWACWLAIERPDRVAALVHVGCPAVVLDTSAPIPMRLMSVRPIGRLMTKLQPPSERQVERLGRMVHEHPLPPEIARLILTTERLDHFDEAFFGVLQRLLRLRGNRSELALGAGELARIRTSTLLIFGADDPMGAAAVGARVAEASVGGGLHVVEGGHAPWLHHADQVAPLVSAFLDRTPGDQG